MLNGPPTPMALLSASFVLGWLPSSEVTGDPLIDLRRALSRPYSLPGKKAPARIVSGMILARPDGATINVEAPPSNPLPDGVVWLRPSDRRLSLAEIALDPPPSAFLALLIEKAGCIPQRLASGGRGTIVINGPTGPRWTARRSVISSLLASRKTPAWLRSVRKLLLQRTSTDDVAQIDADLAKSGCDTDLLDLLERATEEEMQVFAMAHRARSEGQKGEQP